MIAQYQYILACFRKSLESKLGWVAFHSVTFELKCLDETAKDYCQTTALISHDLTGNMYCIYLLRSYLYLIGGKTMGVNGFMGKAVKGHGKKKMLEAQESNNSLNV